MQTTLDFGHVTLRINDVRATDSGIYTCKAINLLGEAVSTTSIKVEGRNQQNNEKCRISLLHQIDLDRIFQYETAMIPSFNYISSKEISQFSYTVKMQKLKSFSREILHLNEFELKDFCLNG